MLMWMPWILYRKKRKGIKKEMRFQDQVKVLKNTKEGRISDDTSCNYVKYNPKVSL